MTVAYVELADYLAIATEITGLDVRTVVRVTNLDLADSALHAPQAGFGDPSARGASYGAQYSHRRARARVDPYQLSRLLGA